MRTITLWLVVVIGAGSVAFAQTTLNMSQDLVRLGIASSNMVPNQPSQDAGPLFLRAVNYAQSHQISRVIADPGAFYFLSKQASNFHIAWSNLSDLTIDLQGSDLYFAFPLASGIIISHGTNVTLQNFSADYNPLPFTQVRVTSVDPVQRRIGFAVDGTWQNPNALNAVFAVAPIGVGSVEVHLFRNGHPIQGVPRMYAVNPVGTADFTILSQGGRPTSTAIGLIRPGDIAFLGMRTGIAGPVEASFCTGCTFRNITAYSSVEWGIAAFVTQSSVFERTYSIPRPGTDRLASTYGQLELGGLGPDNQLRLNRIIRTMDNGIVYMADFLGAVQSQTDIRTLVFEGDPGTRLSAGRPVPNGTTTVFQRPADGAILTSAVIVSQVAPPYTGQQTYQVTFTFDRDLPSNLVGTLAYSADPDLRGANSVIERNALEEETDCCRGFLIQGPADSTVHGNYIRGGPMAALQIENALHTPGGSPPVSNLTISNNVIDHTNWTLTGFPTYQLGAVEIDTSKFTGGPAAISAHQNVSVTGNFVADSGSAAVWLGNTSGGTISGNYFLNPNNNPSVESSVASFGPQLPVVTPSSQNIAIGNNVVDTTSWRMWVTDGQYRELAAYAPGSIIRLNAYDLGTLPNPTVTITDADGNTAPVAIQQPSAHAIDVQIPLTAALGGAYLTLTSGSLKYFGTLFIDSVDNIPAVNGCTYQMSPSSFSVGGGFGNLPILVVTQDGCPYQILGTDSFVTPGPSAMGTGIISAGFTLNPGAARPTTIEIAGQPISLTQAAQGGSPASRFVPITPCRVADTRNATGSFGGPPLAAYTSRAFVIPNSSCNIPSTATAYSLNVAVVPQSSLGYLTVWPTGESQPFVATLTSPDGRVRSNAAIVPAGTNGAVSFFATNTTDVVIDVNGYFVPAGDPSGLAFYPLAPCRIADTRNAASPLGGPALSARGTRIFPIPQSSCGIPAGAQAYSLNFAAVPNGTLGYLTAWPTGKSQPLAASLNAPTGAVTANAVIVPAGANGSVDVYSTNDTDLVIDIDGYFAPPGPGGLSLYNLPPCRVLDTRLPSGTVPFSGTRSVSVSSSGCGAPPSALAYVFNATVVPPGPFGYLTMWPQGQSQPFVASLNASDGAITSNMAIVPTLSGSINAFAVNPTQLVLDIFGYFAP